MKQLRNSDIKPRGDSVDIEEADVPFASLNAPNVAAVQIAPKRKVLLGNAALAAQYAYMTPKIPFRVGT